MPFNLDRNTRGAQRRNETARAPAASVTAAEAQTPPRDGRDCRPVVGRSIRWAFDVMADV